MLALDIHQKGDRVQHLNYDLYKCFSEQQIPISNSSPKESSSAFTVKPLGNQQYAVETRLISMKINTSEENPDNICQK